MRGSRSSLRRSAQAVRRCPRIRRFPVLPPVTSLSPPLRTTGLLAVASRGRRTPVPLPSPTAGCAWRQRQRFDGVARCSKKPMSGARRGQGPGRKTAEATERQERRSGGNGGGMKSKKKRRYRGNSAPSERNEASRAAEGAAPGAPGGLSSACTLHAPIEGNRLLHCGETDPPSPMSQRARGTGAQCVPTRNCIEGRHLTSFIAMAWVTEWWSSPGPVSKITDQKLAGFLIWSYTRH